MKIVIDLQGAQGTHADRGIGRYSLALAKAMIQHAGQHEILLALNANFPEKINFIRKEFKELLPEHNIHVWQAPIMPGNLSQNNIAERIRESFLASLNPDILHISSLFEGWVDQTITSIGVQELNILTASTLFDLIPAIHREQYLKNPNMERWYERKSAHLSRANLLLSISESSRLEAIRYLGFPEEAVVDISTAADSQFKQIEVSPENAQAFRQHYQITKSFILYTGGMDYRKNIEGLIEGFALLPEALRQKYQLVIVCEIPVEKRPALNAIIKSYGLKSDDVTFTGYVPEKDLVIFYNLCDLFVFPSLHEGFGLPILEAMSCGAPVIGSNVSSMPEVIGREDALFDPSRPQSICEKIYHVLTDLSFYESLKTHSLTQAKVFSWDNSAKRALEAFEALYEKRQKHLKLISSHSLQQTVRPKLAYFSPLPPAQTGIADYSAELLPELNRFYEIDVVIDQAEISHPWIQANCAVRDISWFKAHYHQYDRILYHFGNSLHHHHMFSLLQNYPGVVVLHDFFLSGLLAHMDVHNMSPGIWSQTLYASHGYNAVEARFKAQDTADVVFKYPCNLNVLENAVGIVTHSEYAYTLAKKWYGKDRIHKWKKIPLLRVPPIPNTYKKDSVLNSLLAEKTQLKKGLGFKEDDFIFCSFGFLGPTKLNHLLLEAWLSSPLLQSKQCHLIFVGENNPSSYGANFLKTIQNSKNKNIHITGFISLDTFKTYLGMTDVAIQLRSHSRGETSAAILDCLNYGISTIVNENGAIEELPRNCVYMLPDHFETEALKLALETLFKDNEQRQLIGQQAKKYMTDCHSPRQVGDQYHQTIEQFYLSQDATKLRLLKSLSLIEEIPAISQDWVDVAQAVAFNQSSQISNLQQIFVDISKLVEEDAKTGIQRVTRSILKELFLNPPEGYRIEPVYASFEHSYYYARKFSLRFLDCPDHMLEDRPIVAKSGDIFLGLDLHPHIIPHHQAYFQALRVQGVNVFFVVYDIIPFLKPQCFFPLAKRDFNEWLKVISDSDGTLRLSRTVANDVLE